MIGYLLADPAGFSRSACGGSVDVQGGSAEIGSRAGRRDSQRDGVGSVAASSRFTVRLVDNTDADLQACLMLAREAHARTIFRDIPFSERKARAIFERAVSQPDRFGLIVAVSGGRQIQQDEGAVSPMSDGSPTLLGFAAVHAGEYFLGEGDLIATVQTLNLASSVRATLLGGKAALRLVRAVERWAQMRGCRHLLVHVTNGKDAAASDRFFRRCGMRTVGGNYMRV